MKLSSCTIWVLGLLLAIASVDTVPDPPAVNPRAVGVAHILCDVCGRAGAPVELRFVYLFAPSGPLDRHHLGLRTESSY